MKVYVVTVGIGYDTQRTLCVTETEDTAKILLKEYAIDIWNLNFSEKPPKDFDRLWKKLDRIYSWYEIEEHDVL